jgi:hypothetical protein
MVAFYKYDIIGLQLVALVIFLIIFFAYSHKFQLSLFESIENVLPYENRYAIMVENIPLIPIITGYE